MWSWAMTAPGVLIATASAAAEINVFIYPSLLVCRENLPVGVLPKRASFRLVSLSGNVRRDAIAGMSICAGFARAAACAICVPGARAAANRGCPDCAERPVFSTADPAGAATLIGAADLP